MEFGTIAQDDVDSLFFTDDPKEVRYGTVRYGTTRYGTSRYGAMQPMWVWVKSEPSRLSAGQGRGYCGKTLPAYRPCFVCCAVLWRGVLCCAVLCCAVLCLCGVFDLLSPPRRAALKHDTAVWLLVACLPSFVSQKYQYQYQC